MEEHKDPSERPPPRWLGHVEALIWVLIYGGLLAVILGVFLMKQGLSDAELLGWILLIKGGVAVVIGALMIWIRSRWGKK